MPLRSYMCPYCGLVFTTKKVDPVHCGHAKGELLITAPGTKFMERIDEEHGKHALKDQQRILKQRARDYSRDHESHDLTQMNDMATAKKNGWVKDDGSVRKKIDDL